MTLMRRSPSSDPNSRLREEVARDGEGNSAWLARLGNQDGIILLGGTSLADFRVRVAQSVLRHDLMPSYWSLCGILLKGEVFASVPFDLQDVSEVPKSNGVRLCPLKDYDDTKRFPNVGVIRFAQAHESVHRDIERVQGDRSIINLPALILPWLGFIWVTGEVTNPLPNGIGLPSAAFVETVFAMAGFELTPGLSSASSCPEAIWQSAKWWMGYYENAGVGAKSSGAVAMVPQGFYVVRQRSAIISE